MMQRPFYHIADPGSMVLCGLLLFKMLAYAPTASAQTLLQEMTTNGIALTDQISLTLPPPTLQTGISTEQRTAALELLSGNHSWEHFSRDSVVAPVSIRLDYVKDQDGGRAGHHVHSAYVVHAQLESLRDKDLMQQLFGPSEPGDADGNISFLPLSTDELRANNVAAPPDNVSYGRMNLLLLGKIQIRAVIRLEKLETPNGWTLAWLIDPTLANVDALNATWIKLNENALGTKIASEAREYRGMGGYLNVARVSESPDVLVVESRLVMHEPTDWFSGSNFVRSKLPLGIQESARSLRRKLQSRR
jgi:hypothetical protein